MGVYAISGRGAPLRFSLNKKKRCNYSEIIVKYLLTNDDIYNIVKV